MQKLFTTLIVLGLATVLTACGPGTGNEPRITGYNTPAGFLPADEIEGPDDPDPTSPYHYRSNARASSQNTNNNGN